jgi:hypothetical protein
LTEAAIFQGTIGALRTIGGRKIIAVTVEVPIEHQQTVAKVAEHGCWVAVARLDPSKVPQQPEQQTPRRRWDQMSVAERAGIRCNERAFWDFLSIERSDQLGAVVVMPQNAEEAAAMLRELFGVTSRKNIMPDEWMVFDNKYQLWLRA